LLSSQALCRAMLLFLACDERSAHTQTYADIPLQFTPSIIIIMINDIHITQFRKSQRNCKMVPQMRWINYMMSNR